jgi:thiol-disulfide isomerase/thioredoxin
MTLVMIVAAVIAAVVVNSYSITPTMSSYKPPVKQSVSKIQSSRSRGGSLSSAYNTGTSSGASTSSSSSRQAAAAVAGLAGPTHNAPPAQSFEDRMRNVLGRQQVQQQQRRKIVQQQSADLPSNMYVVHTLQEYKDVVASSKEIVLVGFFASSWCKACQQAVPYFYALCKQFPSIKFVHVPVTQKNVALHQGLGVTKLPSGHLYHPSAGLVEDDLKLTKKRLGGGEVLRLLKFYQEGSCSLQDIGDVTNPFVVEEERSRYEQQQQPRP